MQLVTEECKLHYRGLVAEDHLNSLEVAQARANAYYSLPYNLRESLLEEIVTVLRLIEPVLGKRGPLLDSENLDSGSVLKFVPIVFDCETTGLSTKYARIVEIAAKNPITGDEFESLVRLDDGYSMDSRVSEITGLYNAVLRQQSLPNFETVMTNFFSFIEKQSEASAGASPVLIGHNILQFDIPLLQNRMNDIRKPWLSNLYLLDTIKMARVRLSKKPRSYNLRSLYAEITGQDLKTAHRALADVRTTIDVMEGLLDCNSDTNNTFLQFFSDETFYGEYINPMRPNEVKTSMSEYNGSNTSREVSEYDHSNRSGIVVSKEELQQLGLPSDSNNVVVDYQTEDLNAPSAISKLQVPLDKMKDLFSAKEQKSMKQMKLSTLRDLLFCFPRRYLLASVGKIPDKCIDVDQAICLPVSSENLNFRRGSGWCMLLVELRCLKSLDPTMEDFRDIKNQPILEYRIFRRGRSASWVVQKELENFKRLGKGFYISARVGKNKDGVFVIRNGSLKIIDTPTYIGLQAMGVYVQPIYQGKSNISGQNAEPFISKALAYLDDLGCVKDHIPLEIRKKYGLLHYIDAVKGMHHPENPQYFELSRRSLAFDDLFMMQLKLIQRSISDRGEVAKVLGDDSLQEKALKTLNFSLTSDQAMALKKLNDQLSSPEATTSLLQGDVGCGKTIIALLCALKAVGSGSQVAIMAPTEVLAEQHVKSLESLLDAIRSSGMAPPSYAVLTGSTKASDRKIILEDLFSGNLNIVIGTHALISDSIKYKSLGLAIVDEQHKFGVQQRAALLSKGKPCPHIINMSATPIPRSLALVAHGEMELITIREMPPGRTPVQTRVVIENQNTRDHLVRMMRREIDNGGKVFVVCPYIEASEESDEKRTAVSEMERLSSSAELEPSSIRILHGRMSAEEKEQAMFDFSMGDVKILISTTVIEVGVNVPDASLMVVEHADRFGLAQLHQLRGRVGRGTRVSECVLVTDDSPRNIERLAIMEETTDGFKIAEADLRNRGSGDVVGVAQSGHSGFGESRLWDLPNDSSLVIEARQAAEAFILENGAIDDSWPRPIREALADPSSVNLDLTDLPILNI